MMRQMIASFERTIQMQISRMEKTNCHLVTPHTNICSYFNIFLQSTIVISMNVPSIHIIMNEDSVNY